MVIHNFDIRRPGRSPAKTDAKLTVDPNTVLPGTIAFQGFQTIAGRHLKIVKACCDLKLPKLSHRNPFDVHKALLSAAFSQSFCIRTFERYNHFKY
ncbi:uncharacterized protein Dmul_33830 [Desulfococcus multivorans]|nr:uncharacterized protein Dmul_33830 [Desulfococcus multivorans]